MENAINTPRDTSNDTPRDLSLILATIPLALDAMGKEATATYVANAAVMAVHDAAVATFGTARCLTATSRDKDATPIEALAYITFKDAALVAAWGEEFIAKVDNGGAAAELIGAPKEGMASNTRAYWQQQKGKVWSRITARIAKVLSERHAAQDKPTDGTKAPNRKAGMDERAIASLGVPIKAIRKAMEATDGKGEQIPSHIDANAFLRLSELALLALSKDRAKQEHARIALTAYDAAVSLVGKARPTGKLAGKPKT